MVRTSSARSLVDELVSPYSRSGCARETEDAGPAREAADFDPGLAAPPLQEPNELVTAGTSRYLYRRQLPIWSAWDSWR